MSLACSILIPAHNEVGYIESCLDALLASDPTGAQVEVIVMANGCTDATVDVVRGYVGRFAAKDWPLTVLDIAQGSKMGALNAGDAAAQFGARIYLDADVLVSPPLIGQLVEALAADGPRYRRGAPSSRRSPPARTC